MLDFDQLDDELDSAGYDLVKIHEIYEDVRAQIQAAPPDLQSQLEARLLELCQKRAELAKKVMDAHMEHLKH